MRASSQPPTSQQRFEDLLRDYCAHTGQPVRAANVAAGAPLEIDGVTIFLTHVEALQPPSVIVRCEVGDIDDEDVATQARALLQHNYYLYDGHSPLFAIDPNRDEYVCLAHFRLEGLDAAGLLQHLRRLAGMVNKLHAMPA